MVGPRGDMVVSCGGNAGITVRNSLDTGDVIYMYTFVGINTHAIAICTRAFAERCMGQEAAATLLRRNK